MIKELFFLSLIFVFFVLAACSGEPAEEPGDPFDDEDDDYDYYNCAYNDAPDIAGWAILEGEDVLEPNNGEVTFSGEGYMLVTITDPNDNLGQGKVVLFFLEPEYPSDTWYLSEGFGSGDTVQIELPILPVGEHPFTLKPFDLCSTPGSVVEGNLIVTE